jgi:hypothetical protein
MQAQLVKQWVDLNKNMMVSVQKFTEINSNLAINLAHQQMDLAGIYMEGGNKQLQSFSGVKNVRDVLYNQSQLASDFNKKLLNNVRVSVEMMIDAKKQMTDLVEAGVKDVLETNPLTKAA